MSFESISPKVWMRYRNKNAYVVIDLRNVEKYQEGHMKNAINIPYDQWEERRHELDRFQKILFYCDRGNVSLLVAREYENSTKQVLTINGGYNKDLL